MKLDPERLVGWLLALFLLVLVVQQTVGAVRDSGVWMRPHRATPVSSACSRSCNGPRRSYRRVTRSASVARRRRLRFAARR